MENKPKRHGYITGYDPVSANIQKSKPFVTKKISCDYPKIEGEFKEEEYGQVPLKTSECVFDVPLLQKRIDELNKSSFKNISKHRNIMTQPNSTLIKLTKFSFHNFLSSKLFSQ